MEIKEIGNSIIKSLFAAVPFAGQPLNEYFYEYRGRIKQGRLNDFTKLLSDYFSSRLELEFSDLNIVEFSDLFESVILRVAHTSSQQKHKRFRDILINYIENPEQPIDHSDTFLELISSLTESSIQILKYHTLFDDDFEKLDGEDKKLEEQILNAHDLMEKEKILKDKGFANDYAKYSFEESVLKLELQNIRTKLNELKKYRSAYFYGLTMDDFLYLKQILLSKALMTDSGIGFIGHIPYHYMRITLFGKQFMRYIKES